jgi:beta-lactamase regulating signal transducer with metallopeptidase domain
MDLTTLQNSVFLQALGGALLNSIWQGCILWLLFEATILFYKKASARLKFNLSFLFLCIGFMWFLSGLLMRISNFSNEIHATGVAGFSESSSQVAVPAWQILIQYLKPSLPFLSVAYICLLFLFAIKLFASYYYVQGISRRGLSYPPQNLMSFTTLTGKEMKIAKKVRLWVSGIIDVPATVGFLKPIILLPVAVLNHLTTEQLEAIIIHELSHIKRNDYLANIVIGVIETVLFFNPFVALLIQSSRKERENCCDDNVLQYQYDPHGYALALLRLEQSRLNSLSLAMGAVSGKKQLLTRIKRITNKNVISRQFNYGQKLLALLVITAVFCSLAWLSPTVGVTVSQRKTLKSSNSSALVIKKDPFYKQVTQNASVGNLNLPDLIAKITKEETSKEAAREIGKYEQSIGQIPLMFETAGTPSSGMGGNQPQEDIVLTDPSTFALAYLKKEGIHIPSSVKLTQATPFSNIDLNINETKIAVNINEALKQAFEGINSVNWAEVQKNIIRSFAKQTSAASNQKHDWQVYLNKPKNAENEIYIEQNSGDPRLKDHIIIQDSLFKAKMVLALDGNTELRQILTEIQKDQGKILNGGHLQMKFEFTNDNNGK